MKLYLACLIILGALAGCATNGPVEMSTEGLEGNQVATLTPAQMPASVLINIDKKRRVDYAACHAVGRHSCPLASMAQMVLAILLARAATATL